MGSKVQFTPPPKSLRPPSEADLAAVANGQSLQLLETWQGSFMSSKLVKAGLTLNHGLHTYWLHMHEPGSQHLCCSHLAADSMSCDRECLV